MGKCLNKVFQDQPQLKVAQKGILSEEAFEYACKLCDGHNPSCSENTNYHMKEKINQR